VKVVVMLGAVSVCGVNVGGNVGCYVGEESVEGVCNGEGVGDE